MNYTKDQLIEALYNEYSFLCHDDFDPDTNISPEEYLLLLRELSIDELIMETGLDQEFEIEEYVKIYG